MGNVHMEATQINYRGGSKKMSVEEAIKAAGTEITPEEKTWIDSIPALTSSNAGKTDQDVIAPEFDAEAGVYAVGDKVMYDGKLYKFTTAHETPGDWNITEVSETTVDDELSSLESGLTNVNSNIASLQTGKLNVIKKETGSGTTFTITFPTHGIRIYALLFGRFGYDQSKLSIAVISHVAENEANIMCLGNETATVSCTGHVVTVTTPATNAAVDVVSPENIL